MTFRFFLPSPRRNDITERVLMERAAKMREQRDFHKQRADYLAKQREAARQIKE